MFIAISDLPATAGHPFYEKLNQALRAIEFDRQVKPVRGVLQGIGRAAEHSAGGVLPDAVDRLL